MLPPRAASREVAQMSVWRKVFFVLMGLGGLALLVGCAPGDARFQSHTAGFWAGLWHGLICLITFVISLFKDGVRFYECNNSGHTYDLGFLLGAMIMFGGGPFGSRWRCCRRPRRERDWDEMAAKVEARVRQGVRSWVDESHPGDPEWQEIGRKIEEKLKRNLRKWADE